ncbi:hypothetical protein ACQ4LE_000688 [Meloidogyne hapla]|uniref:Probable pectate lyase F n=1 Tax=Meloidogyne hapla TaxID=6305 RepID=A0A1I8BP72_MELHA
MFLNKISFVFFILCYSSLNYLCEADSLPNFWPKAKKDMPLVTKTIPVGKKLDCDYSRYTPDPKLGTGNQEESQRYVFELKDGATLSNCIIGAAPGTQGSAHGILCSGSCTVVNVFFEDVGEDAITFRGTSGNSVYNVVGGAALHASDKVLQVDGKGTLKVTNYYVKDYVRFCRSCGNCDEQFQRNIEITNLTAINGKSGQFVCGINSNYKDKCTLHDIKMEIGVHPCKTFTGVENDKKEPSSNNKEENNGDEQGDGTYCIYKSSDIKYITNSKPKKKSGRK